MDILVIIGKFIFTTLAVYIGTNIAINKHEDYIDNKISSEYTRELLKDVMAAGITRAYYLNTGKYENVYKNYY